MLLIPIYMVYDLQLTRKKKIVVLIVLCLGLRYVSFCSSASATQITYFMQRHSSWRSTIRNTLQWIPAESQQRPKLQYSLYYLPNRNGPCTSHRLHPRSIPISSSLLSQFPSIRTSRLATKSISLRLRLKLWSKS